MATHLTSVGWVILSDDWPLHFRNNLCCEKIGGTHEIVFTDCGLVNGIFLDLVLRNHWRRCYNLIATPVWRPMRFHETYTHTNTGTDTHADFWDVFSVFKSKFLSCCVFTTLLFRVTCVSTTFKAQRSRAHAHSRTHKTRLAAQTVSHR